MNEQGLTYNRCDHLQKLYPPDIDKYVADYDTYDEAGRLTGMNTFNGTGSTFNYDNANRTQSNQSEPYQAAFTAENVTYTYNTQKNRLQTAGADTFSYDNEGQLNSGYGSNYTFDYEHRLTAIGGNVQFTYDGNSNRIQATRNGTTTRYIYDAGGNLLAEADANNNVTKYYIHGKGLMAMVTPQDQTYCYHYNATGSTIALTDMGQNIVNAYAYDPFGNVTNQVEPITQPFKFVGQFGVMTEPNGFYYMRARYYDPKIGRFISEDPIGFGGGDVNLMAYVANNPIMVIDPSGLWGNEEHGRYAYIDDGMRHPWLPWSWGIHFAANPEEKRATLEKQILAAAESGDMGKFDELVHSGQDSFNPAHTNPLKHLALSVASPFIGDPDSQKTYKDEYKQMDSWTKKQELLWNTYNPSNKIK